MTGPRIFTIGHSTHAIGVFIEMIRSFRVELVADIRNFAGSKRYPHFNSDLLHESLKQAGINYVHFKDLGGRRAPRPDSVNNAWRVAAFKGYADYMETQEFKKALVRLEKQASEQVTAYMCSEAVWWSCHRALVSDVFKVKGWTVLHIMKAGKAEEHPYTKPALIINGELSYRKPDLFNE